MPFPPITPFLVLAMWQHVVELEDGGEEPIMEIREWLDESGEQTSVDVTDLGKVRFAAACRPSEC